MADNYKHILLATDLLSENDQIAEKASQLAKLYKSRLSILHVVENIPIYFGNEMVLPETRELEAQLAERAKIRLDELAKKIGVANHACHIEVGMTKMEILTFIENHSIDLVVLGRHRRHGIERLLGSTANAVLNVAPCDVLAVRVAS